MATYNELIYDIIEDVTSRKYVDDSDISERQVKFKLNTQRALWIRNEYNKPGRTIDPFNIQSLGCVELEAADSSECPDLPADCTLLRTVCEIPRTIELHHKVAITKVGPIDKLNYFFSFVPYAQAVFSGEGKFSKNTVYAFLYNNRMYFKVTSTQMKFLTRVNIMGIFEDPTELASFCNAKGDECYSNDSEYPLSNWMVPFVKEQVIKELLIGLQIPEDRINDASSKTSGNAS